MESTCYLHRPPRLPRWLLACWLPMGAARPWTQQQTATSGLATQIVLGRLNVLKFCLVTMQKLHSACFCALSCCHAELLSMQKRLTQTNLLQGRGMHRELPQLGG